MTHGGHHCSLDVCNGGVGSVRCFLPNDPALDLCLVRERSSPYPRKAGALEYCSKVLAQGPSNADTLHREAL
ncbi:hypothetical protein NFI96_000091 [Prochilodus magdalenae]|nr:hypothetical protein NFI96_000091 [Prochilodus magdalenae]